MIFDIETIPVDFAGLGSASQQYLMKFASTAAEREKVLEQMALWAPTNRIVAIGVLSAEQQRGAVYYQSCGRRIDTFWEGDIRYVADDEHGILRRFWKVMARADRFVTFNGRGFDCPVLMQRSAMLCVSPSKNLMPYRYSTDVHVDLLDQLTYYGATRKFNLDMFCKAFGIDSPKSHGVTGHDVGPLFESGQYQDIARYCAGDLGATRALYLRWREYLAFPGRS